MSNGALPLLRLAIARALVAELRAAADTNDRLLIDPKTAGAGGLEADQKPSLFPAPRTDEF